MNKDYPDYGIKNQGNIVLKERHGKNSYALFKCKTCKRCFSETRSTAFFGLDTPQEEVLRKIWSFIKKQKNVTEEDYGEYGDVYSLTAVKIDTRLFLFHHEGNSII